MNDGLKRAIKEAVYFFLLPLIASLAIGKGITEYLMWAHDATKANGISGMYAFLLAISPLAAIVFIGAVGLFYWLNNRVGK